MPNILALDTSSENCSVALYSSDKMSSDSEHAPRNHTQRILPMVKSIIADRGLTLEQIDAVAFGCGPGSFTGVRISTGVAQGLAFGLDCPVFPVSNLEALAVQSFRRTGAKNILVALDARMDEIYWGQFNIALSDSDDSIIVSTNSGEHVCGPESIDLSVIDVESDLIGVGKGMAYLERFPTELQKNISAYHVEFEPDAEAICELAMNAFIRGDQGRISGAMPSYVRDTITWKKLPGRG